MLFYNYVHSLLNINFNIPKYFTNVTTDAYVTNLVAKLTVTASAARPGS